MLNRAINALELIKLGPADGTKRKLRGKLASMATDTFFNSLAYAGRYHPLAHPKLHGVSVKRGVRYAQDHKRQKLDIYRPLKKSKKTIPIVFYVHGGGFRAMSKDSHWLMGLIFAKKGYLVVNVDYGVYPKHRYPEPLKDVFKAYAWLIQHAQGLGGDPSQIIVAGESAGANLIMALICAYHFDRPESYACELKAQGHPPVLALPQCGILQVTDIERYERDPDTPSTYVDLMNIVSNSYFTSQSQAGQPATLADPLRVLEEDTPASPLPPCFISVGGDDPLRDDSFRLGQALLKQQAPSQFAKYPGEIHAFQMLVWRKQARRCWRDTFDFIERHWPSP
jgi:acetyl esterase